MAREDKSLGVPRCCCDCSLGDWTKATIQVFSEKTTLKESKIESNTFTLLIQIIDLVNIPLNNKLHWYPDAGKPSLPRIHLTIFPITPSAFLITFIPVCKWWESVACMWSPTTPTTLAAPSTILPRGLPTPGIKPRTLAPTVNKDWATLRPNLTTLAPVVLMKCTAFLTTNNNNFQKLE